MSPRRKAVIGVGVVGLLLAAAALSVARGRDGGIEVRMEEVERRNLVSTVTASGNIRARRTVDISSDISARVQTLFVDEGDDVEVGQILLQLDPSQYEAGGQRAQAGLSQAAAQAATQRANLIEAQRSFDRLNSIYQRDSLLVSMQQLEQAETALDVARANMEAADYGVRQAEASLSEADEQLSKTIFRAPMAGRVTRLNVDEGETVIIGTMNNPGSLVLTISDLSTVEVVVRVDETDTPELTLGDSANVEIDAFPDEAFTGRITRIGNSAITPPSGASSGTQSAVDFEVVITLDETSVPLRPDLSATADIVTETRTNALSVPIIALTVRPPDTTKVGDVTEAAGAPRAGGSAKPSEEAEDIEGVFVVQADTVVFTPVQVGITGEEHFEILSGVAVGDTVVAGPYTAIRQLVNGDRVKRLPEPVTATGARPVGG